jgi:hypothetical protein
MVLLPVGDAGRRGRDSSVKLDQILEDQLTPAISARLDQQPTFRQPAKLDRREAESFRKHTDFRCGGVIVARQEHDLSAAMPRRLLGKDRGGEMVEALDQSCTREGLRDEPGRGLSSQFLWRHAVGIGRIDDGFPLPGGKRLRDIRVLFETDSQKDDVRLDGVRQCLGNDSGADRGRIGCNAFWITRGRDGYFDAVAGKCSGQSLADSAEADDCIGS